MTVREIVQKYLKDNGFDGLCNDDCGCSADDICLIANDYSDCEPAYKRKATKKDREYNIGDEIFTPTKPGVTDEKKG